MAISGVVHIALALSFAVKTYFFPTEKIEFQRSVRVDLVALPDKLPDKLPKKTDPKSRSVEEVPAAAPKTQAPVAPIEAPKAASQKKKVPVVQPKKEKKTTEAVSDALRRLRAKQAINKIQNLKKKKAALAAAAAKPVEYKGNILSPGTALTGLNKVEMGDFVGDVDGHIKENWILPEWMANRADLSAQVLVRIDAKGFLKSIEFIKRSSDPKYDEIVEQTVRRSEPFPAPPDKFRDIVAVQGIKLGFPE